MTVLEELYSMLLFQKDFIIDKIEYKSILQLFLQVKDQRYARILILQNKKNSDEFVLTALGYKTKEIVPIPLVMLNAVIRAIKHIPFLDKLNEYVKVLSEQEYKAIIGVQHLELSKNIGAFVSSTSVVWMKGCIELELTQNTRIKPGAFIFAAFDGINTCIYFELDNEHIEKDRAWGILSKIKFYLNNDFIGEYYALKNTLVDENTTSFFCQTKANLVLSRKKMAGLKIEGVNVYEISDFIISSAGLYNSVDLPEEYKQIQKWYTIVMPVIGLEIPEEFGIGSVEFCTKCNIEIKRVLKFIRGFNDFEVFALVHINSEKIYSAFLAARRQIQQSIDLIVNILKDDSLFSTHSLGNYLSERCIENFDRKVSLSTHVYIESPLNNMRLAYNFTESGNIANLLVTRQFLQHKDELEKAELLLIKANGTNDKEITPLFNSLKWIRKSWDTDDFEDKIINIIIALEFIVSKEANVPMMDRSIRKSCIRAIGSIIQESYKGELNKDVYLQNIAEKFHRAYTESPFMLKLTNLINRLKIPVSEDELQLISLARTQRNEIIHGRNEILLPTDDIYKLCECISRIAFYKIDSLEV